jgi:hypothetical protein
MHSELGFSTGEVHTRSRWRSVPVIHGLRRLAMLRVPHERLMIVTEGSVK